MTLWQHASANCNDDTISQNLGVDTIQLPVVSIILCTYNRCNMVLSTLASLRRQTLPYKYFEVIVVDNGSSDTSPQSIRAYVKASMIHVPEETWQVQCLTEAHNGLAHARNRGLQVARGTIAVFLDDDTLAVPNFLSNLLNTYEATGADAIGGRVELHWEAPRPYWLTDDLLPITGYFAPSMIRMPLPETLNFSASNFSVKMKVLNSIGPFTPFLSKRLHVPIRMESVEFCQRLRKAGYALWYDPDAVVNHRVPAARMQQAFFVGRAHWQGRSEAMLHYVETEQCRTKENPTTLHLVCALLYELYEVVRIAFLHRPLLHLAGRSTEEKLQAALAQTYTWGHLWQQLQFIEHAPALLTTPAVLFVHPDKHDTSLLLQGLSTQDVHCTISSNTVPLSWLWRHRAYRAQPIGIVHVHRSGAFALNYWQHQHFLLRLWLAQRLGIRIVTTDTGGLWHNMSGLHFLLRRSFERRLFSYSNILLTYARQNIQLYPNKKLRRRVRFIVHPGYRGYYPPPVAREQAYKQLGLPYKATFVYLCFAYQHSERELLQLIDAFTEAVAQQKRKKESSIRKKLQLLLVGSPKEKKLAQRLMKQAALNAALHLFMEPCDKDLPLYMGAANVVVIPHFAQVSAGMIETASLALSYERIVVAPDLPRFRGVLPSSCTILYDSSHQSSLIQALVKAQSSRYHLKEKDRLALDATSGWRAHAKHLFEVYRNVLEQS